MKKALVMLVLLAAAIYVASWFWAGDEVAAVAARPWPHGLGTLAAVREWSFGGKTLRFAKPIALPERRDTSMPLTLHLRE